MVSASYLRFQKKLFGKKPEQHVKKKEKTLTIWSNMTTFHGVVDWYIAKHWASFILWFVLFVICLSVAIFQISSLIQSFNQYPHYTTNLYTEEKEFADFPNITICNFNRVNKKKLELMGMSGAQSLFASYLFWSQFVTYDAGFDYAKPYINPSKDIWDGYLKSPSVPKLMKDPYNMFRHLGHQCEETFVLCLWGGQRFNCCNEAKPIINGEYGLCWTMIPPRNLGEHTVKQSLPGLSNGLKIILNVRLDLYLKEVFLNNYLEDGMVIEASYNPYHMNFMNPIAISPGTHARLALTTTSKQYADPKIEAFEMECTKTGKLEIMKGEYDRPNCIKDCIQQFMRNKCGCTFVSERKTDDRTCDGNDVTICLKGWTGNIEHTTDKEKKKELTQCMDNCKQPCKNSRSISTVITTDDFPTEIYAPSIAKLMAMKLYPGITVDNVRNAIMLDVYFPTRGYLVIERAEKFPLFSLIGNVGGQMGLWLGASILTLIQSVYYLFYGIFRVFYDKKRKGKKPDDNDDDDPRPPKTVTSDSFDVSISDSGIQSDYGDSPIQPHLKQSVSSRFNDPYRY